MINRSREKLKVGVGLMCRHCVVRKELFQKIKDGAIGDINLLAWLSHVGTDCFVPYQKETRRSKRSPLSNPELPQFSLGQWRRL